MAPTRFQVTIPEDNSEPLEIFNSDDSETSPSAEDKKAKEILSYDTSRDKALGRKAQAPRAAGARAT